MTEENYFDRAVIFFLTEKKENKIHVMFVRIRLCGKVQFVRILRFTAD